MKKKHNTPIKSDSGLSKASEIAQPVRKVIQRLLHEKKIDPAILAKAMGKAKSTMANTKYHGFGGFDTMVSSLLISYGLEDVSQDKLYNGIKKAIRELNGRDEADIEWDKADKFFSRKEKKNWAIVMNLYGELSHNLPPENKKSTQKK